MCGIISVLQEAPAAAYNLMDTLKLVNLDPVVTSPSNSLRAHAAPFDHIRGRQTITALQRDVDRLPEFSLFAKASLQAP